MLLQAATEYLVEREGDGILSMWAWFDRPWGTPGYDVFTGFHLEIGGALDAARRRVMPDQDGSILLRRALERIEGNGDPEAFGRLRYEPRLVDAGPVAHPDVSTQNRTRNAASDEVSTGHEAEHGHAPAVKSWKSVLLAFLSTLSTPTLPHDFNC
jgi:hypothetical protein